MSEITVQASFNSGEWAPSLFARVDLAKYKSGAALLRNFFVDYRGGASTRTGTAYVIQCKDSAHPVRLVPFQASFNVGYILEIGNGYIRFIYQGSPILESAEVVTGATNANPCVVTILGHNYVTGDWVWLIGIGGMGELNNHYYIVGATTINTIALNDLNGNPINSTAYGVYTSGGLAQRVYTIASPYTSSDDLRLIKFAQNVNEMILCHPNHPVQILTLAAATNWTIAPLIIGSSATAPDLPVLGTTLAAGNTAYAYGVTTIDDQGQESSLSAIANVASLQDMRTVAGSMSISWNPVANGAAYNVYASNVSYFGVLPYGVEFGFIGTTKGNQFIDTNIGPDFTQTPPIAKDPFTGFGVASVTITAASTYTTVPNVLFTGACTVPAQGLVYLQVAGTPAIAAGGAGYNVNDVINLPNRVQVRVTTVSGGHAVTGISVIDAGELTFGSTPANPVAQVSTTGGGTGATFNITWGVGGVIVTNSGAGYGSPPAVSFTSGSATATAALENVSTSNPTVPSFFQQRLVLAASANGPSTFNMSQPGAFFNFDISEPSKSTDAISGTLVSGVLNTIKAIVSSTSGMLVLTDKASWMVNGGSSGAPVTPSAIVANAQSFIGANDVPPIVANYDILYVPSKGSGVRDLAFNIYFNVFTGTDISLLSSHLFYGYNLLEWTWAEQPFYTAWAVRDDGKLLTLTFLKEQEFTGWTHSDTTNGLFKSVASVTEPAEMGSNTIDAVYVVVERVINGYTVKYTERFSERIFPRGVASARCVDSSVSYIGSPAQDFTGAEHLAGQTVTGLADGKVITPFVMPANGGFHLATPASEVTVGLGFTCQLQTLALDMGEPTIQGKVKKINNVDVRVADTLNLLIGQDFDHLVPMKDLRVGNVSSMLTGQQSQVVTDLVTGDARTILSPAFTVPGQYCIQQTDPMPASILGVFPSITIGDPR